MNLRCNLFIMKHFKTFTSFSVGDMEQARSFYGQKLGLDEISMENEGVFMVQTGGDTQFMVYHKEDHTPAEFTVLNFLVDDLDALLESLKKKGVLFEKMEGAGENGILEMGSARAAWTRDPAGNWIGFFQDLK
jgi:catechol 2,3-dioxygenase-like lactoylglutathione lyase family enzyme